MTSEDMTHKYDTQVTGNTTTVTFRARSFQLTLHNIDEYESVKGYLTEAKIFKYLISCMENCPKTDKKHIHIYVHYSGPKVLSPKKCGSAHIEKCRGSPKQNIEYIKKDGNILDEIGEIPSQGVIMTVGELRKIKNPDELHWKMHNTWTKIQNENQKIKVADWGKNVKVYYISGPPGVGKTEKAKTLILENKDKYGDEFNLVKFDGKFWNGAQSNSKVAVYDDFRDSHMPASEFIQFIDYNRQLMNIKGGSCKNDYELIILTSVIPLKNIYKNVPDEPRNQWERRIEEMIMSNPDFSSIPPPKPDGGSESEEK